jgi:uncharacterized protein with PIN domain
LTTLEDEDQFSNMPVEFTLKSGNLFSRVSRCAVCRKKLTTVASNNNSAFIDEDEEYVVMKDSRVESVPVDGMYDYVEDDSAYYSE